MGYSGAGNPREKSLVLGNPPMEEGRNRDYLGIFTSTTCRAPVTGQANYFTDKLRQPERRLRRMWTKKKKLPLSCNVTLIFKVSVSISHYHLV